MLVAIVEDQDLSFFPLADGVVHPDCDRLWQRVRHDQPQMEPEHPVVGPAVRLEVRARFEDREYRRLHAGDRLQDAPGLWALPNGFGRLGAVAGEDKRFPVAVGADRAQLTQDFVAAG